MRQTVIPIIAAGLALVVIMFFAASYCGRTDTQYGTLVGKVAIGPWCGAEPVGHPCTGPNDTYSSRSLILTGSFGNIIFVKLGSNGTFNASLPSGTYDVGITNCTFAGCHSLRENATVYPGRQTNLSVIIDTGIR